MAEVGTIVCEIRQGKGLQAMVRTLRICFDMLDVLPEWNATERDDIKKRIRRLRRELKHLRLIDAHQTPDPQNG
jgi:hypothetical protein